MSSVPDCGMIRSSPSELKYAVCSGIDFVAE